MWYQNMRVILEGAPAHILATMRVPAERQTDKLLALSEGQVQNWIAWARLRTRTSLYLTLEIEL
jgi:hypothetical protein